MYLLVPRQFLAKMAIFCQNSTFTQSNNKSCVRDFFSSVFSFGKIKGYYYWKNKFYRLCQIDCKLENSIDVTISDMTPSSIFFDVVLFLLSSLVIGPSFMSIWSLVLELWQFHFIRDWPEIWKLGILLYEFCPISDN